MAELTPLFMQAETHSVDELAAFIAAQASVPDLTTGGSEAAVAYLRQQLGGSGAVLTMDRPLAPLLMGRRELFDGPVLALAPLRLSPVRMHTPRAVAFVGRVLLAALVSAALCTAVGPLVMYALSGSERLMLVTFLVSLVASILAVALLALFLIATRPLVQPRIGECQTVGELVAVLTSPEPC